jgi:hypothetical protein
MAYRGEIQVLCKNGHLDTFDVASDDGIASVYYWYFDPVEFAKRPVEYVFGEPSHALWQCPVCGQLAAWVNRYSIWWNDPDNEEITEGPVALEFAQPPVYKIPNVDIGRGAYFDIPRRSREAAEGNSPEGTGAGEKGVREDGGECQGSGGA